VVDTTVKLTIPATPDFLRLARLTAADVGSRVGLTFEEVDDLRIAVDELCFVLVDGIDDGALHLVFVLGEGRLSVEGHCDVGPGAPAVGPSELAKTIIAAVVDGFAITSDHGTRRFEMHKRIVDRS
jgi:hypothetical protein